MEGSYALGAGGMKQLSGVEERAKETAQAAYDAAQKEVDARQETPNAFRCFSGTVISVLCSV